MNDMSHAVAWRDTEQKAMQVAVDLSPMHDPASCGVDCHIQQQNSTRRRLCFCAVLASLEAYIEETAADTSPAFHPVAAVRLSFARQLNEGDLAPFLDDPDRGVRELAYERLTAFSRRQIGRLMMSAGSIHAHTIQAHSQVKDSM